VDWGVGVGKIEGGDGVGVACEEVGAGTGIDEAEGRDDGFCKGVDEFVGIYWGRYIDGCGGRRSSVGWDG
jgi:hypothetical protein